MERGRHGRTARSFIVQGALLLLPLLAISAVFIFASRWMQRLDRLESPDKYSETGSALAQAKLSGCLQDLNKKPSFTVDQINDCVRSSGAAPSLDEQIKTRIDELKWTLTLIGSIGAFFVIAQSAAAFFSALLYTRQAESTLAEIETIQEGVLARYPVFREVEERRGLALLDLERRVKISSKAGTGANPLEMLDYEYKDTLYSGMPLKKRQELLSIESFASIDLDPGPSGSEMYSDSLRRLAYFYQSKFKYEGDAGFGSISDLERAEGYLLLAVEKSKGDFTVYNDLGVVRLDILKAIRIRSKAAISMEDKEAAQQVLQTYKKAARSALIASRKTEPVQMRAYHNLAVLSALYGGSQGSNQPDAAKKREDYNKAIKFLIRALKRGEGRWQCAPAQKEVISQISYNLGCYKAWILGNNSSKKFVTAQDAQEFMKHLYEAVAIGGVPSKVVEADFNFDDKTDSSDLAAVYKKSCPAVRSSLEKIKGKLRKSTPHTPMMFNEWEALADAYRHYNKLPRKP